jgi:peptidoglycan/LPS O-acetylase OafA/YrhL
VTTRTLPAHAPPRRARVSGGLRGSGFQPEIQGLRAVAVLLVVMFHLWPNRLSGGFVGVDVFFVISGYLITAHIYREAATTGSLSLRRFWARRVRRLLPAALLVLALSAVATVLLLPATVWGLTARQIAASALYVQNWALASDAVDYMAKDNVPTIAQHYWSLSVEEQFYLVWPVLILGLVVLSRRRSRRWSLRGVLIAGFAAVGVVSLAWSVVATASDQSSAYFVTPTRVWEFVVGALAALLVHPVVRGEAARGLLAWLGLGAIVGSAMLIGESSPFPGWIALFPVLGTVAVIMTGATRSPLTPAWWLSMRPMTFVGDISYSVYLWHWPLIILVPYITGVDLRTLDKIAIFAATITLAWISKVTVEDPLRSRPFLAAMPWRSFAFAAVSMLVVVSATVAIGSEVDRRAEAAEAAVAAAQESAAQCVGPRALDPDAGCDPVSGSGELVPPPEVVVQQNVKPAYSRCQQTITVPSIKTCTIGSADADPVRTIAVVGDSHATHWFAALDQLGRDRNWKVLTYAKASCPMTTALRVLPDEQTDEAAQSCLTWVADVRDQIAADESITAVFTSAFSSAYQFAAGPGPALDDPRTGGFQDVWGAWTAAGKDVLVIRDIPPTQGDNVPNCLAANPENRMACATEADALPADAIAQAAETSDDPRVHLIDLTDRFCDATTCYPVVGDMIVYRDYSHLSGEYATALVPYLAAEADRLARIN